ncbi:MAG: DUF4013 domain-containing protein [Methanoregula sp.]|jgi:hypothetical protein|uniref:DUF4013 domain-containing protein n=1 Tax=Methanoregula sp. TaxID=2052170 RepID=UPI003C2795DB
MDFGKNVSDSLAYAQEGLVGKWVKWVLLIISTIIFPLILGYVVRILKGANPSPELEDWGGLFIDGIKLFIVALIYAIPIIILEVFAMGSIIAGAASGNPTALLAGMAGAGLIFLVLVVVAIIIGLFEATAYVRFARTGSFGEAFNFSAILAHIGKIGWVSYIIALIILAVIWGVIEVICMIIPYVGILILLVVLPFLTLFASRYLTLLYDSAGAT